MYKNPPKLMSTIYQGINISLKASLYACKTKILKKRKPVFYTNNHATTLTTFQKRRRCHSILPIQDNKSQIGISKTTSSV